MLNKPVPGVRPDVAEDDPTECHVICRIAYCTSFVDALLAFGVYIYNRPVRRIAPTIHCAGATKRRSKQQCSRSERRLSAWGTSPETLSRVSEVRRQCNSYGIPYGSPSAASWLPTPTHFDKCFEWSAEPPA